MSNDTFREYFYKDIVQALLMRDGIHEGLWQLQVNIGFGAINAKSRDDKSSASSEEIRPAAVITINHLALTRVEKKSSLTFDAADLNPEKRDQLTSKKKPVAKKKSIPPV